MRSLMTEEKLNRFHRIAVTIAEASPDNRTKVGALLINKESGTILSNGYNGFVRGANDDILPNVSPDKHLYIIHSEVNLICNAAKHGVSTNNCILYCTLSPCINCMRVLYQSGIHEIYIRDLYKDFENNTNMLDLCINLENIGAFKKITLTTKK